VFIGKMVNKCEKIAVFSSALHNGHYPVKKSPSMSFKRMPEKEAIQINFNSLSYKVEGVPLL